MKRPDLERQYRGWSRHVDRERTDPSPYPQNLKTCIIVRDHYRARADATPWQEGEQMELGI